MVANSAPCGACRACREGRANLCESIVHLAGAFAERLRVPAAIVARNTLALPAGLAPALAAMAEPLACALHSAARCGAGPGDLVLILGGGAQGQLLAGVLAGRGCRVHVADPHPDRRARALRFGAEAAHEAPAAQRRGRPAARGARRRGADVVVEAVGRPETWRAAAALARPGGRSCSTAAARRGAR